MEFLFPVLGVLAAVGIWIGVGLHGRAVKAESTVLNLMAELEDERHAARHDPLTGLPNRRGFYERGADLVADPDQPGLVAIMFDLDDFKKVNDTLGHATGDQVLVTVAERLSRHADGQLVARLGGDEFAGLLSTGAGRSGPNCVIAELADLLAAPIWLGNHCLTATASIGVAPVWPGATLSEVLGRADSALYQAKATRSRTAWFDKFPDDYTVSQQGARPSARTRDLQPIVLMPSGVGTGDRT